jgi:hypothetical protein
MLRTIRDQNCGSALGDTWQTAEQEDAVAVPCVPKIMREKIRRSEVQREGRPEKEQTGDIDPNSVIDKHRIPQDGPKALIPRSEIQYVSVYIGDDSGVAALEPSIEPFHRL